MQNQAQVFMEHEWKGVYIEYGSYIEFDLLALFRLADSSEIFVIHWYPCVRRWYTVMRKEKFARIFEGKHSAHM